MLQLDGIAEPGATLTLIVVDPKGDPVPDVKVSVKVKREAGTTDVNGQLIIDVPEGTIELYVEARLGDERGELEVELSREDGVITTGPEGVPPRATGPLTLQLEGDPQPGATSTLVVTDADGNAVEGAVVMVNGEVAGTTDTEGRLSFSVQEGADDLKIKVKLDESKGELEVDLEDGGA